MALEPKTVSVEDEGNPELRDMQRRFWVSLAFTTPLLVLSMGGLIPGVSFQRLAPPAGLTMIELLLASPVVLWGAWPFFLRAWRSVTTRNLNMFTLIGLGVGVAFVYSIVAALFPDIFPDSFRDGEGRVSVYFEAAAVITTLVLLGQVLELKARSHTSSAIKALLNLAPKTARKIFTDGRLYAGDTLCAEAEGIFISVDDARWQAVLDREAALDGAQPAQRLGQPRGPQVGRLHHMGVGGDDELGHAATVLS